MINAIYLHNLRNGEFIQLMTDLLTLISQKDPVALKVVEPYNALKARLESIESMFRIKNDQKGLKS